MHGVARAENPRYDKDVRCADDEVLANYCSGELAPNERLVLETHLDGCGACTRTAALILRTSFLAEGSDPSKDFDLETLHFEPGTQVSRYIVLEELGRGAMGIAYAAYDVELDRKIALKVVATSRGRGAKREARAMARLNHPNVVSLYDVVVLGDVSLIAMEFVIGETLSAWVQHNPSAKAVCEGMREVGKGLEAAHSVGLVHCDIKPENIMVGADGRPRIMDFGLAKTVDDAERKDGGTVLYMAPEHRQTKTASAASDQYSYCLTFAEALGARAEALDTQACPAHTPRHVWRALQRGAAPAADARFASMHDLLVALRPRSRSALWGIALVGIAGAAVVWLVLGTQSAAGVDCDSGRERVDAVWNQTQREAISANLRATGARSADGTVTRLLGSLDRYSEDFALASRDSCQATHVRGDQSERLLDARMMCLSHRLSSLDGVVDLLSTGQEPQVLGRALRIVATLPAIEDCSDVESLGTIAALPPGSEDRARIEDLTHRLYRLAAEVPLSTNSGKQLLELMREDVVQLGYSPLLALFHYRLGNVLDRSGEYQESATAYEEASKAAALAHDDVLLAQILNALVAATGYRMGALDVGQTWASAAELAMARAGSSSDVRATFAHNMGMVLLQAGKFADARVRLLEAVRLLGLGDEEQERRMVSSLDSIGTSYYREEDYESATRYHEHAIQLGERTLGPHHQRLASPINNLALVLKKAGKHHEAIEALQRAHAILLDAVGPASPSLAMIRVNMALSYVELSELDKAEAELAIALPALESSLGARHPLMAETVATLAMIASEKKEFERAITIQKRAIGLREQLGVEHPAVVNDRYNLAGTLCAAGRNAEAEEHWEFVERVGATLAAEDAWQKRVTAGRAECP